MAGSGQRVAVDGEVVLDNAKRIDAATVADAPTLVTTYEVGGGQGSVAPALKNFVDQLEETLDTIAANVSLLNKTVAVNTDALRSAVKTLNGADADAKAQAQSIQSLLDGASPKPAGARPAAATTPAAPAAPSTVDGQSAADYYRQAAGSGHG